MRRPQVDYRKLRLHNLNTPQFRHLYLLLGWVGYFILYYLTEQYIPMEHCHLIHVPLDDKIPFREELVVFYVGWYLLIILSLGYLDFFPPACPTNRLCVHVCLKYESCSVVFNFW